MRKPRIVITGAIGAVVIIAMAVQAGAPTRVVDTTDPEFGSAAGGPWVAWSRGSQINGDYDVYIRATDQVPFVLEAGRFQEVGSIEIDGTLGDVLAYSVQRRGEDSEIRLYDLTLQAQLDLPTGVNSARDDDNPLISGDHLLFGRGPAGGAFSKDIYLYDLVTNERTLIAEAPAGGSVTANGLRGDFATYTRCPSNDRCNVIRYQLSNAEKITMPNPGRANYWSSLADDGTVYFVQGHPTSCGVRTKIMRFRDGTVTKLIRFEDGIEVADLDVVGGLSVDPVVHFTRISCVRGRSGIWKIAG